MAGFGGITYKQLERFVEHLREKGYEKEIPAQVLRVEVAKFFDKGSMVAINRIIRTMGELGLIRAKNDQFGVWELKGQTTLTNLAKKRRE